MTSRQRIEITVSPTGETSVQTKGFQGESCREASRLIEKTLGRATGERLTAEFHLTAERCYERGTQR